MPDTKSAITGRNPRKCGTTTITPKPSTDARAARNAITTEKPEKAAADPAGGETKKPAAKPPAAAKE